MGEYEHTLDAKGRISVPGGAVSAGQKYFLRRNGEKSGRPAADRRRGWLQVLRPSLGEREGM